MKMNRWLVAVWALVMGFALPAMQAQDPAAPAPVATGQKMGVIKESHVNLRGKATIHSEVVSQLQEGERVIILEEITLKEPKKGDPEKWLKIALPPTSGVWVHSSFIDATTKTVKADLLNLRGGPGENYSVLGRVPRGTLLTEMEAKESWVKVQAPPEAYAFVASYLVQMDAPGAVEVAAVAPAPAVTAPPPAKETTTPPPIEPVPTEATPTEAAQPAPAEPLQPPPVEETPLVEAPPAEELPIEPTEPPPPPPKRIVSREGIVRRSFSIQAPTEFVLEDLHSKRTINYLNAPSTNIVLKDFFGMRILVTGEELLDERWKTPVLNIDKLEPVP